MTGFIGTVKAEWITGNDREMKLLQDFTFVDNKGRYWLAPKGSIVDGASIPEWLWSMTGSPFVGLYREASVIHDVFCKTKSKPYKEVHEMFYHAMLHNGVSKFKAKKMYYAVKLGGPKW